MPAVVVRRGIGPPHEASPLVREGFHTTEVLSGQGPIAPMSSICHQQGVRMASLRDELERRRLEHLVEQLTASTSETVAATCNATAENLVLSPGSLLSARRQWCAVYYIAAGHFFPTQQSTDGVSSPSPSRDWAVLSQRLREYSRCLPHMDGR